MAQLVEHHLAKVGVAGSSPVVRSRNLTAEAIAPAVFVLLGVLVVITKLLMG